MKYEIKNNLYHALPILLPDGRQINLGGRGSKFRKILLSEEEGNFYQIKNLSEANLLGRKAVKR